MESGENQETGYDATSLKSSKSSEVETAIEETETQRQTGTSVECDASIQTRDGSEPVEEVIDDLSKQLVDNLLKSSETVTIEKKYVTMHEQIETKEKEKQVELARKLQLQAQLSVAGVHKVVKPLTGENFPPYDDALNSSITADSSILSNGVSQLSSEAQLSLPGVTTNGHAATDTLDVSMLMERNSNADHQSDGTNLWSEDLHDRVLGEKNVEVDILTAVSEGGMCDIQSLPHVLDGLSDGEITPDSDDENSGGILEELNQTVMNKSRHRSTLTYHVEDDPFYKNHEKMMSRIDKKQMNDINDVLSDIVKCNTTSNNTSSVDENTEVTSPIWHIRDSYSESLKKEEDKRQRRIELEKQYELEYRQQHMNELEALEKHEEIKVPIGQPLEEETEEPAAAANNTDYIYSSDEDPIETEDRTSSFGWIAGRQNYTPLTTSNEHFDGSPAPRGSVSAQRLGQISNAARLADHERCTSPTQNKHTKGRERRSSNGSLNSYSSSSQSSNFAPSTVIRRKPDGSIDSSSSDSWDSADQTPVTFGPKKKKKSPRKKLASDKLPADKEFDTDEETDELLNKNYNREVQVEIPENRDKEIIEQAMKNKAKEVAVYDPDEPTVLIEGILFRAAYLGSTQLISEAQPSKAMRMMQAQEAVGRIKVSEGEHQPSTDVDLFVSTEKVMVLNTDLKEIMMDHALRSISYIADIDNILVLMAKRSMETSRNKEHKLICHIFETDEAHLIAQSIGQAFQVAYIEFLKANGIDEPVDLLKDTSYEDILEQQEIMNDELEMFTRKDMQKDVVVPKSRNEILGVVIVESGWGSVLPTVILANMSPTGAAARCGMLNIGDQIMSINGISLVGLPLSTCQEHIRAVRNLTAVRLCVVSRTPVIEVLIKRPDKKYQLGFSVQNGVICSLLRGGIAERGGVRVGHRIIEINSQSVVAVTHDKIVHMLSTSVGEIHMKTMPMAVFKLLTGQEIPQYI